MKRIRISGNRTATANCRMEARNRNNNPCRVVFNPKAIFVGSCYLLIIIVITITVPSTSSFPVAPSSPSQHTTANGGYSNPSHPLPAHTRRQQQRHPPPQRNHPHSPTLSYSSPESQPQDSLPDYFYSTITSRLPLKLNTNANNNATKTAPPTPEEETTKSSRLRWLQSGYSYSSSSSRNTSEIRMRDPIALGGLPRSERYAASDWLHNTLTLPNSAILKKIRGPVLSMTAWGTIVACVHRLLEKGGGVEVARGMCITTTPHSMMVRALGLLLVFRTNSAYQRFAEGRKIWENILNTSRDLSRLCKLYEPAMGSARLRRIQRLLAAFPYLLRSRIRPSQNMKRVDDPEHVRDPEFSLILYSDHATSDSDEEAAAVATDEETTGISRRKTRELYWVDRRTLPWRLLPSRTMEECARAQNRPLWVCDRMAKEFHSIPDAPSPLDSGGGSGMGFTARERLALMAKVEKLSNAIGSCERIHQTVVPLNYARHSLRSLTVWLLSLPFALVGDMGFMTGPILFVTSWMMFGVYEIGCSIEDPFQGALRLSILCDAIRRDVVGEEIIRNTAFELKDEVLSGKEKVELKKDDYLEDELDRYDDDDEEEEYGVKEDMYKVQIENIMIDPIGIPYVVQESESHK